ncbi:hypothetical protein HDU67_004276 [Dinochytrium kinnereticum]|nr:hypothetical protein HDU67_004276 [Dinochytrium kinnereticum]
MLGPLTATVQTTAESSNPQQTSQTMDDDLSDMEMASMTSSPQRSRYFSFSPDHRSSKRHKGNHESITAQATGWPSSSLHSAQLHYEAVPVVSEAAEPCSGWYNVDVSTSSLAIPRVDGTQAIHERDRLEGPTTRMKTEEARIKQEYDESTRRPERVRDEAHGSIIAVKIEPEDHSCPRHPEVDFMARQNDELRAQLNRCEKDLTKTIQELALLQETRLKDVTMGRAFKPGPLTTTEVEELKVKLGRSAKENEMLKMATDAALEELRYERQKHLLEMASMKEVLAKCEEENEMNKSEILRSKKKMDEMEADEKQLSSDFARVTKNLEAAKLERGRFQREVEKEKQRNLALAKWSEDRIVSLERKLSDSERISKERLTKLSKAWERVNEKDDHIRRMNVEAATIQEQLREAQRKAINYGASAINLSGEMQQRMGDIAQLESVIAEKEAMIDHLKRTCEHYKSEDTTQAKGSNSLPNSDIPKTPSHGKSKGISDEGSNLEELLARKKAALDESVEETQRLENLIIETRTKGESSISNLKELLAERNAALDQSVTEIARLQHVIGENLKTFNTKESKLKKTIARNEVKIQQLEEEGRKTLTNSGLQILHLVTELKVAKTESDSAISRLEGSFLQSSERVKYLEAIVTEKDKKIRELSQSKLNGVSWPQLLYVQRVLSEREARDREVTALTERLLVAEEKSEMRAGEVARLEKVMEGYLEGIGGLAKRLEDSLVENRKATEQVTLVKAGLTERIPVDINHNAGYQAESKESVGRIYSSSSNEAIDL